MPTLCFVSSADEAVCAGINDDPTAGHPERQRGRSQLPEGNGGGAERRASRRGDGAPAAPQHHPGAEGGSLLTLNGSKDPAQICFI